MYLIRLITGEGGEKAGDTMIESDNDVPAPPKWVIKAGEEKVKMWYEYWKRELALISDQENKGGLIDPKC